MAIDKGLRVPAGVASFPVPHPAFHRLQYRTATDEKLGVGLGTRLLLGVSVPVYYKQEPNNLSQFLHKCTALFLVVLQMAVALEAMADGGVLVGIPRPMAQRIAAYTMMVWYIPTFCY